MKAFINFAIVAQFVLSPLFSVANAGTSKPTRDAEPDIKIADGEFTNPEDWRVKNFRLIFVINKAPSKSAPGTKPKNFNPLAPQTVTIYQKNWAGIMEQIGLDWVSTGRNKPEYGSEDHKMNNDPYFSQTHAGYFVPTLLNIDHVSGRWDDAKMPHAVFFDQPEGEAMHEHPPGTEGMLGNTASGGCARTTKATSKDSFWRVRYVGGPLRLKADKANFIWNNEENHALETGNKQFMAEYQEMQDKGWGKLPDTWPNVPMLRPSGPVKDKAGNMVYTQGYAALFIVVNQPEPGGPTEESMTAKRLKREAEEEAKRLEEFGQYGGFNVDQDPWSDFRNDDEDSFYQQRTCEDSFVANTDQGAVYEDCDGNAYLKQGKRKVPVEIVRGRNGKIKRISTIEEDDGFFGGLF